MKKIKLNGAEFTTVKAVAACDSADAVQDALFVHFEEDEFHDGDLIVFGYEMPEDDRDVENILSDVSAQESCFFLSDDGIYYGGCCCKEDME